MARGWLTGLLGWLATSAVLAAPPRAGRTGEVQMAALTPVQAVRETTATPAELAALSAELGDTNKNVRRHAFSELTRLTPDALDSIRKRLTRLARRRPPLERVLSVMTRFRTVQGESRADSSVDLAAGILRVLERQRGKHEVAAAEPLLLLRSLEAIGTPQAAELALEVFALDNRAWRWESQRTLKRFGKAMLPALVLHETRHPKYWVRRFCRWGIDELGLRKPGLAVQEMDVTVLAALLRAYGHTLFFEAMPVIVSYVSDERILVRQAAREAIGRFGRNAIWQIREAYLNATGKDADPDWSHGRALKELYAFHDVPRKARVASALSESAAALEKGDEANARHALSEALHKAPTDDALGEAASAYASLGERALGRDDLRQAELDFRRALRLNGEHPQAARWRAQLSFVQAEQRLTQGMFDRAGYERTIQLDPSHERAQQVLDTLSPQGGDRTRRAVAWLAAALLAAAGLTLLRREAEICEEPESEPLDETS